MMDWRERLIHLIDLDRHLKPGRYDLLNLKCLDELRLEVSVEMRKIVDQEQAIPVLKREKAE